jgi:hypothetical protein
MVKELRSATVPVVWTASGKNKLRLVAGFTFPGIKFIPYCCCDAVNLNTAIAGGLPAAALLLLILDSDVRRAVGSAAAAVFVLEDTFAAPD